MSECSVIVCCGGCGYEYEVSARYARMLRKEQREPVCRGCESERRRSGRAAASVVVMQAEHNFWISRFGLAEAAELAACIWGPAPATTTTVIFALAASAQPREFRRAG